MELYDRSKHKGNTFKIKSVTTSSTLINPLLVNIDNRALTKDELEGCDCLWYDDHSDRSTRVVSFTNTTNKDVTNYQGKTKLKGNMCKTMLVLQSKTRNKVQLLEVSECHLGREVPKTSLKTNYDNDEMHVTYEDNKSKLLKAFGSKKSNRASIIGSKMKINSEMMMSQIEHSAADVNVDVKELEQADSMVDTCMPTIHRDAISPEGVFLLEDFLSQKELDSLEDEAFTILHLMPFTEIESGYSQFLIDALDRLQNKVNSERIKVLLYVDALMKFLNLPLKKQSKKEIIDTISPYSNLMAKRIIDNFSTESAERRMRNITMDDKIVIYIIVLVIIACGQVNTEELSKYLTNFRVVKIGQIARALCLSTRDKITWFVKLPLPSPGSKFIRRRK